MDIITVLLIAVGLSVDAFAVSIATGITTVEKRRKNALLMASFFGGFQMLMPIIGWAAGLSLQNIVDGFDHWLAFGLLSFIGAKMIYDAVKNTENTKPNALLLSSLLTLSIATSIDALMVGFSFAFLNTAIVMPILLIGIVTFSLSFSGFIFGCGIGKVLGNRVKIVGGLVLIAIGIKIVLDSLL